MADKLVSMRELSRIIGVTLRAVQDAVKYGRIKPERIEKRGQRTLYRFDPEKCKAHWSNRTRPGHRATRKEKGKGAQPTYNKGDKQDDPDIPGMDGTADQYHKARAAKEIMQAKIAKLELEEKEKTLVRRDLVRVTFYHCGREISKHLLNIPDRVAAIVAAETDILACNEILTTEIKKALTALSQTKLDDDNS